MKDDPRCCDRNLCSCVKKPEKNSGLQRGLFLYKTSVLTVHLLTKKGILPYVMLVGIKLNLTHRSLWTGFVS